MKENTLCEVCRKRTYTKLCDHKTGTGITSSSNFHELTQTCDKKLCDKCAINLWSDCDVCPDHASDINDNLTEALKGWIFQNKI